MVAYHPIPQYQLTKPPVNFNFIPSQRVLTPSKPVYASPPQPKLISHAVPQIIGQNYISPQNLVPNYVPNYAPNYIPNYIPNHVPSNKQIVTHNYIPHQNYVPIQNIKTSSHVIPTQFNSPLKT